METYKCIDNCYLCEYAHHPIVQKVIESEDGNIVINTSNTTIDCDLGLEVNQEKKDQS